MKRALSLYLFLTSIIAVGQASDIDTIKYWKVGGKSSFTFNQVTLNNWSAGGKNSIAGTFLINAYLNYSKKKVSWDNAVDLGYGLTKQGADNLVKTEDKIYLLSKFGYQVDGSRWYYSGVLDFKTQFDIGYNDPPENSIKLSKFMAPAYLNFSLGMDYKPNDNISFYLSPLTSKTTIVLDDSLSNAGAFGVKSGKNFREEYGASLKLRAQRTNIIKNVDVTTRLDLFSNLRNNPKNIDVDWEIAFSMNVNDYLSAVVSFNVVYDDDVKFVNEDKETKGPRVQMKQLFGFGVSYKFGI